MATVSLWDDYTMPICRDLAPFLLGNISRLVNSDVRDIVEIRISRCNVCHSHLSHECYRHRIVGHQPFLHAYGFAGSYHSWGDRSDADTHTRNLLDCLIVLT